MSMNRVRFGLMSVFLLSLAAQLAALFLVRTRMWPNEFQDLLLKLLAIYSVQLGVVLGGIFAQSRNPLADPAPALAWAALLLAVIWNLLLVSRSLLFAFAGAEGDSVTDLMKYLEGISSASSFLVAGGLAFFFGKGTAEPSPLGSSKPGPREDAG
jgi:hypothetical protein